MIVHSEEPFNGEFPPHLLGDAVTPTSRHFVRNNGGIPGRARSRDPQDWKLTVDGEVRSPRAFSYDDLGRLPQVTRRLVVECAGNGRSLFAPAVGGTQWVRGAVACSEWTGVRLRDVLQAAGLTEKAVYLGNHGEDEPPFSRGIPVDKAMDEHTLIALKMNGEPLPAAHGFPARLLVPGWIGSSMQKWLHRIQVRDTVHDSRHMSGYSYRVPAYPVAPGHKPPESDMAIATSWRGQVPHHRSRAGGRSPAGPSAAGQGTRLGRRGTGGQGARLHRLRGPLAGDAADPAGQPLRLVRLDRRADPRRPGLLRDLGPRLRRRGQRPALPPALEPQGLPRQRHPPGAGAGGLKTARLRPRVRRPSRRARAAAHGTIPPSSAAPRRRLFRRRRAAAFACTSPLPDPVPPGGHRESRYQARPAAAL